MAITVIDPAAPARAHVESYWAATSLLSQPLPRLSFAASCRTCPRATDVYFELQERY